LPYKKENKIKSKQIFLEKATYVAKVRETSENYDNFVDFNFGEKILYGRVSRNFVPITLRDIVNNLKPIASPSSNQQQHRAVNFVVDQFDDLRKQFDKCVLIGKINPEDPFLSNLNVFKSYTPPSPVYQQHYRAIFSSIQENVKNRSIKISNSAEFKNFIFPILLNLAKHIPITKQAFLKSKFCPISVSGLAIEIANSDTANDQEKIIQFLNSRNWEFYVNTCRSFGFMVDQEVPWRLVADIASDEMLRAASAYNLESTSTILNILYSYETIDNFLFFKSALQELFFTLLADKTELIQCEKGSIKERIIPKTNIFNLKEDQILKFYLTLRLEEEEKQLTQDEAGIIVGDIQRASASSLNSALFLFEQFISQPFSSSGSLSDYRRLIRELNALSNT